MNIVARAVRGATGFTLLLGCVGACLTTLAAAAGQSGGPVATVDLCGEWSFAYTTAHTENTPPVRAFRATMPVPGCWDDRLDREKAKSLFPDAVFNPDFRPIRFPVKDKPPDASLPYLLGTGWYRRQVDVPAEWKGRQITLLVGRVVMEAWVFVNGREVHHHLGHSTSWEVPLGPHLAFGQPNELVIAVDNTRRDRLGSVIRGWQGRSAGIFGPVAIRLSGRARIADLYIFHHNGRLQWRVEIQGDSPQPAQLQWRVFDPQMRQLVLSGTQPASGKQIRWTSDAKGLSPWSDRQPDLHQIEVALHAGDECLDVCQQPFGLRRLTTSGTELRLNGRPIFLRGSCECGYFPLTCTPPVDVNSYRAHISQLKEIGFNWLRCHTWVPLEPYLQAADELGMLIQVEPPTGYALPEWRDILRACRKHPSVVIYCCGNEQRLDEEKIAYLRQCADELRATVPDALFNPQEALRGVEYGWSKTDMGNVVQEPFPHNPSRLAKLKEFSDVFGQFTWGLVSYTSLRGVPDQIDRRLVVYERPCLTHELGICGCYLDLSLEPRYQRLRIGPDLYAAARQELQKAGLLDRAPVYYRNSVAWQRLMIKDAMETARACRLLAGYDCLGASDNHWHRSGYACGLLNEFDELKHGRSIEDIRTYNGESVLLVSRPRERNLQAGQPLRRELSVSWFGDRPLKGATLRWSLTAAQNKVLAKGSQPIQSIEPGKVHRIASIDAPMPAPDRPAKSTLHVELALQDTRLHNAWDFWIFPAENSASPDNVRVVKSLDPATVKALAAGQRVVLLGSKPFPARAISFQMGLAGRPEGNLATVIARHPLTDRFPHDGYCDWQFSQMLAGAAAVEFDTMPAAFDPILEVVSSYKHVRRQAALFEWRVGQGRLLVCSLNLPDSDPAAGCFRRLLMNYAAGSQLEPRTQVTPEQLDLFTRGASATPTPAADTDRAFDNRGQLPEKKK